MKKLFALAALALTVMACGSKQYEYEELVLDYPSIYKVSHEDVDESGAVLTIDDGISTSMDIIFIEIFKDDPESFEGVDDDLIAHYLIYNANRIQEIMRPDEDITFTKVINDEDDIEIRTTADGSLEAFGTLEGTLLDDDFHAFVFSKIIDNHYRITAYGQASTPSYLKNLEDIYQSIRKKQ